MYATRWVGGGPKVIGGICDVCSVAWILNKLKLSKESNARLDRQEEA
jgi:hypothetical protein